MTVGLGALTLSLLLACVRLFRGPSLPDRVISLEMVSLLAAGLILFHAIATDEPGWLDAAIVIALISFLGTVAFGLYLEKRASE
ncbi:MAG: pesticidal protein Cry22Aa [Anaerolineae bacterium]|nr:pesticidal protein Cry22Aa [Anaerolineae bacterium]